MMPRLFFILWQNVSGVSSTEPPALCEEDEFECADGKTCVPLGWHCDYVDDCGDNSDETENCTCDTSHGFAFACKSGGCIIGTWVCDGTEDCFDGSDEGSCHTTETSPAGEGENAELQRIMTRVTIFKTGN